MIKDERFIIAFVVIRPAFFSMQPLMEVVYVVLGANDDEFLYLIYYYIYPLFSEVDSN
jgi:hypothetical protein